MHRSKLFVLCMMISLALSCATSFYPKSLTSQKGSASSTSLAALQTQDQSGTQDKWDDYVEFYSKPNNYNGVFVFDVSNVTASSVSSYTLNVNFKGPKKSAMVWQFEYMNVATGNFELAGDNAKARDWKWSSLSFDGTTAFADLVSQAGQVELQLSSSNANDNCDIDFLQLSVVSNDAGSAPATEAPVQPTEEPTQDPSNPEASEDQSGHHGNQPTQAPTKKATQAPTKKPTPAPTQKPTKKPTPAPTPKPSKSTPAPTQKPSKGNTPAPTTQPSSSSGSSGSTPVLGSGRVCAAGTRYVPGPSTTWQWQLSGKIDTTVDVQMYDIDMFDSAQSLIDELHAAGRAVTCYIDTAYEPGRPDSSEFTAAVKGNGIDGWPGQFWVDIRTTLVRNIMVSRIEMAASKGCDAVEMDDVDSYQNNPGFPITAADQLDFNSFLATTAHANDLGIALKNDIDQVGSLVDDFDFAINEQCFQYKECTVLDDFIKQNKAVFGVEYNLATTAFCDTANADKFSWLKKDLNLDAKITECCPTCTGTHQCVATTAARSVKTMQPAHEAPVPVEAVSSATQVVGCVFAVVVAMFAALF